MEIRRHESPGCGGCLLLIAILLLLTGGAPALFNFLGFLLVAGIFVIFAIIAAFWGVSYFIRRQVSNYEQSQTQDHNAFVVLLIGILIKTAQVDGVVTPEETDTIYRFFRQHLHYNQAQMFWVRELVKESLSNPAGLDTLVSEFRNRFGYEPRLILLNLVYEVIYSKDKLIHAELEIAQKIADFLGINAVDQNTIKARYAFRKKGSHTPTDKENQYYQTLGLTRAADWEAIKKSYRQLSMQYHPDKVTHLGEEFRNVAEEKMKELNEAYQYLKKKFNN